MKNNKDWNIEQLEKTIDILDSLQAKFFMDSVGIGVCSILDNAQKELKYLLYESDCESDEED